MSTQLIKYDAARHALAEALRVDEVKPIRDMAVAAQHYARQAKNTEMIENATDIRFRAEAKLGQLLTKMKATGERDTGKGNRNPSLKSQAGTPKLANFGVTKTQSSKFQKLGALTPEKREAIIKEATARAVNATTSAPRYVMAEFTGENEWYTPPEYFPLVKEMFGKIDLCPASNQAAQDKELPGVPCFTKETNGLTKEWRGRIWLNPPYSKSLIGKFVSKLVGEFKAGRVTEAIMLVNNNTDTEWFHEAEAACSAICFTKGRVKFYNLEGEISAPKNGQAFIYFGRNPKKFAKVFADVGFIR